MERVKQMLLQRKGDNLSVDDWAIEINKTLGLEEKERLRRATLYSYLNGSRMITATVGAKLLAQYFYTKGDLEMVDALCQLALGIPYPRQGNGKG